MLKNVCMYVGLYLHLNVFWEDPFIHWCCAHVRFSPLNSFLSGWYPFNCVGLWLSALYILQCWTFSDNSLPEFIAWKYFTCFNYPELIAESEKKTEPLAFTKSFIQRFCGWCYIPNETQRNLEHVSSSKFAFCCSFPDFMQMSLCQWLFKGRYLLKMPSD